MEKNGKWASESDGSRKNLNKEEEKGTQIMS